MQRERLSDPVRVIREQVLDATLSLFEAHDQRFTHAGDAEGALPRAPPQPMVAASIGYTGDSIRGSLVLLTSSQVAGTWSSDCALDEVALCDIVGEFSNMLLGRVKSRIIPYGVTLSIALPISAIGRDLRVLSSPGGVASLWQTFRGDAGDVHVRLDLNLDAGFAMYALPEDPTPSTLEGDVLLF